MARQNGAFYIIVAFVSILSMVFIPLLDSDVKGDFVWPNTTAGWILWLISTGGVAIVNMCIFYCFMEQAKVNSKDDEKYKEAVANPNLVFATALTITFQFPYNLLLCIPQQHNRSCKYVLEE